MDASAAFRLVVSLSGAGFLLVGLYLFIPNAILKVFGLGALAVAVVIAFAECGIDVGSLLLFGIANVLSVGWLVLLAYFPKNHIAARKFRESAGQTEPDAEEENQGKSEE